MNMKKILLFMLLICLCVSAVSCVANNDSSVPAESMPQGENSIALYSGFVSSAGNGDTASEFAGDLVRPENLNHRLGTMLWAKMDIHKDDPDYLYHVMLRHSTAKTPEELVSLLNSPAWLNAEDIIGLDKDYKKTDGECRHYYYVFTAEQINELLECGILCRYVGSGVYDEEAYQTGWSPNDLSKMTKEGIEAYAERWGDQIAATPEGFEAYPDIIPEES